jgi:hypothetical protein
MSDKITLNPEFCLLWYCPQCEQSNVIDTRQAGPFISAITEHLNASPDCPVIYPEVLAGCGWYKAVMNGATPAEEQTAT